MDSFIKLSNFGKIAPYAQLFRQGLLVTVLLSLFTVDRFRTRPASGTDAYVEHSSVPWSCREAKRTSERGRTAGMAVKI